MLFIYVNQTPNCWIKKAIILTLNYKNTKLKKILKHKHFQTYSYNQFGNAYGSPFGNAYGLAHFSFSTFLI